MDVALHMTVHEQTAHWLAQYTADKSDAATQGHEPGPKFTGE